ncbi:hypothetical protein R3L02_41905 [Streptomyces scabiei]|uniref:hypothetical protein n=1 Tax=Streptomyces scabiei TaxID=1930 RepID=UPI00298EF4BD|nr:hypothetical protein [Streptomyces scabiei]MDW8478306.1 hypothetical protein [Streptomyces scabiei]
MSTDVAWSGEWRHEECGASGDAIWEDEDSVSSLHECDQGGEVTWSAEWQCHNCGASGLVQFEDDSTTYADHDACDDEDMLELNGMRA